MICDCSNNKTTNSNPIPTANFPEEAAMATPKATPTTANVEATMIEVLRHLIRSSFSLSNAGVPSLYFSSLIFSHLLSNFQA